MKQRRRRDENDCLSVGDRVKMEMKSWVVRPAGDKRGRGKDVGDERKRVELEETWHWKGRNRKKRRELRLWIEE